MEELLVGFVEVSLHFILFQRSVYPSELFQLRRYLMFPVRQSRHPELNNYISSISLSVYKFLKKRESITLAFNIHHKGFLRERYVFELNILPSLIPQYSSTSLTAQQMKEINGVFLSILTRLNSLDNLVGPMPPSLDSHFTITIHQPLMTSNEEALLLEEETETNQTNINQNCENKITKAEPNVVLDPEQDNIKQESKVSILSKLKKERDRKEMTKSAKERKLEEVEEGWIEVEEREVFVRDKRILPLRSERVGFYWVQLYIEKEGIVHHGNDEPKTNSGERKELKKEMKHKFFGSQSSGRDEPPESLC